jgi:hypothetical protein
MNREEDVPSATPKQLCSVRGLVAVGSIAVLLGLSSLLYASQSSFPEIYQLLAAALVVAGLGTFAKIPRKRRLIRDAKAESMTNRSNQSLQPTPKAFASGHAGRCEVHI